VLETPVTGGNVSFYNESPTGAVFPTPTIGMLGVVEDVEAHATTFDFKNEGDVLFLLQPSVIEKTCIEGSEYLALIHGLTAGDAPCFDLHSEKAVQDACLSIIQSGLVNSAHDVSDGGLAVCLAEMSLASRDLGAEISLSSMGDSRLDAALFGEAQSRIVIAVSPEHAEKVQDCAAENGVAALGIGKVTGTIFSLEVDGHRVISTTPEVMRHVYESAIPNMMARKK